MRIPVRAKIYFAKDGATALKAFANVDIGGILFVNSYSVSNTTDNPNTLRASPPSYKIGGKYKPYIEFANGEKNPLAAAIYKACRSAYSKYEETGRLHEYGDAFEVELDGLFVKDKNNCSSDSGRVKSGLGFEDNELSLSDIPF